MNKCIERLYNGIIKENPTFVLMLGMCPTLAVTTSVINATYNNNNSWTYENDTITLLSLVNNGYKMFVIEL